MQDSSVLLSDTNRFTISGNTFLDMYPASAISLPEELPLTGSNNLFVGVDAGQNMTSTAGSNNTVVGTEALANLGAGSSNLVFGGSAYTGTESGNICIGSQGVLGDNNATRIGTTQTTCFIKGLYGVNPMVLQLLLVKILLFARTRLESRLR